MKMYKLTQTSDLYECASPCVIDPVDNDADDLYVGQIAMLLRYSDKWPSVGIRATAQNSKDGNLYQSARKSIRGRHHRVYWKHKNKEISSSLLQRAAKSGQSNHLCDPRWRGGAGLYALWNLQTLRHLR